MKRDVPCRVHPFLASHQVAARTDRVLADFGFTGDEEPFSLSRGQRQRVALASILPPQMIDLSLRLDLPGADSPETMADAILAAKGGKPA